MTRTFNLGYGQTLTLNEWKVEKIVKETFTDDEEYLEGYADEPFTIAVLFFTISSGGKVIGRYDTRAKELELS